MNFYIYIYLDPRKSGDYEYGDLRFTHEPFYVGKGSNKRYRPEGHTNSEWLYRKVRKIGAQNTIIEMPFFDAHESVIMEYEKRLITEIGRQDLGEGPLVNLTDGGGGSSGRVPSQKTRDRISKSLIGRETTEEHRKNLSRANKGKKLTEECKKKISQSLVGRKQTEEVIQKRVVAFRKYYKTHDGYWKGTEGVFKGCSHTEEAKKTISKKKKKYYKENPDKVELISKNTIRQWEKGQFNHFGENHYLSKLTWDTVDDIRKNCKKHISSIREYAEKYGVSVSSVYDVLDFRTWKRKD